MKEKPRRRFKNWCHEPAEDRHEYFSSSSVMNFFPPEVRFKLMIGWWIPVDEVKKFFHPRLGSFLFDESSSHERAWELFAAAWASLISGQDRNSFWHWNPPRRESYLMFAVQHDVDNVALFVSSHVVGLTFAPPFAEFNLTTNPYAANLLGNLVIFGFDLFHKNPFNLSLCEILLSFSSPAQ
jgi:hypothetical protein